jgi:hypothetical protein
MKLGEDYRVNEELVAHKSESIRVGVVVKIV